MAVWNPWHGCRKHSAGCLNCYMYRRDAEFGKDSSEVRLTSMFRLPEQRKRNGEYKLCEDGFVYTCMTSDFFLEEADEWRQEAWLMIRRRPDLRFYIITKRIDRFEVGLPNDWGEGYENVTICSTCENSQTADYRLPILLSLPIKHKQVIHEPMLEAIDISKYLASGRIEKVVCGGESGEGARLCDYDWILYTREQCIEYGVPFYFKQTGALFRKDGVIYRIPRRLQHSQALKAGINIAPPTNS